MIYVRKRVQKDIWQNLHEFVLLEATKPIKRSFHNHPFLRKVFPNGAYQIKKVSRFYKQQLSHQNIHGQFIMLRATQIPGTLYSYELVKKEGLKEYAFPKFINKFLEETESLNH